MTTTHTDRLDAAVKDLDPEIGPTVLAFLAAVAAGRGRDLAALYADDATADCTVPNWRFTVTGNVDIGEQYAVWYADPAEFGKLDVRATPGGVVVTFLVSWEEHGVPHAAHHCHLLDLDAGRIVWDTVFCGGRWSAALLATMEEAARAR